MGAVRHHSDVIASMSLYEVRLFNVFCHASLPSLQRALNLNVLDALDMYRTINPYYIFWRFAQDDNEKAAYAKQMNNRQEELQKYAKDPAVFIEQIYVKEDWRRRGVCRFMLDVLNMLAGDATTWLNMEPSSGSELVRGTGHYPTCTMAQVGQMNLNAVIAEKLGFTIDPDYWHRNVEVLDSNGNKKIEQILVRKCAYKISQNVADIIRNDGELVEKGRILQKHIQQGKEECEGFLTKYLRYAEIEGNFVAEVYIQKRDKVRCIVGMRDSLHRYDFFLSDRSVFTYGLHVPRLETYDATDIPKQSEYYEYFMLVHNVLDAENLPQSEEECYYDFENFEN